MRTLFWLFLVAAAVMAPSILMGPGVSHSSTYNFVWTSQFGDALRQGTLYPRWLPGSFEGMGAPVFFFYPPLAFWLSGGLDALGLSTEQAINGAAFVVLLLSGLAMHHWLKERSQWPLAGAIAYMVAPYHLLDFGVRGALAEFASFIWLPLIALGIARLPERRGVLLLGCSFAGMILTHLPMATLTGLFLIAPLVVWRIRSDRTLLLPAIGAGLLGVALSAFYLLPAAMLQAHISVKALWAPYYNPVNWHFFWHPDDTLGNLQMLGLGLIALSLAVPARNIWTVLTIVTAVAAIGIVPFLWLIPPLDKVQFPWRLLGVTEFVAITALFTARVRLKPLYLAAGAALLIVPYALLAQYSLIAMQKQPDRAALATLPDAVEYVPPTYNYWPIIDRRRMLDLRQYRDLPRGTAITVDRPGPVTMGRWDFPAFAVEHEGKRIPSAGPILHFEASAPGTYRIVRVWLWQEVVGGILSVLAVLAAAMLARTRRAR
ncbi:YfhO family protein [Sphingobium algorifonticola]|uniref:Integral membrane-like protein n=1 Tax=Sphingobium algorifonticola TaxID=2008318 RepID=A0A437J9R4_9SPHN|nr:YfhO family protein [Sphingobium algorifonticola]RVT42225.1 integral membrane-like protein [Sphingobium algorifonticola]